MKNIVRTTLKLPIGYDNKILYKKIAKTLQVKPHDIESFKITKESIDARKKTDIFYLLTVDVELKKGIKTKNYVKAECFTYELPENNANLNHHPVIAGAGPAGLFAAYTLAKAGLNPIITEQGSMTEKRIQDVGQFWKKQILNEQSNVQFGEGGAGTFSDGKLYTGIKDPLKSYVLETFVKFGAPSEILYKSKPHIGTDKLRTVIINMRNKIIALGGEFLFDNKLTNIKLKNKKIQSVIINQKEINCDALILAIGHNARDTFSMLYKNGIPMEQKPFSIGVRIEHTASVINEAMYGDFHESLPAAEYKMAAHLKNGRGVYTFCMCPGGSVVAAASESGGTVTNGMSNFARDGEFSNSAILVSIDGGDFGNEIFDGINFQREIERKAYEKAENTYLIPAQNITDFINKQKSEENIKSSIKIGTIKANLWEILPDFICEAIREGILNLSKKYPFLTIENAVLYAPETRSSSPVRIIRNENRQSEIKGIYPCGEGAGYAGGIMSAAIDGIKTAHSILNNE